MASCSSLDDAALNGSMMVRRLFVEIDKNKCSACCWPIKGAGRGRRLRLGGYIAEPGHIQLYHVSIDISHHHTAELSASHGAHDIHEIREAGGAYVDTSRSGFSRSYRAVLNRAVSEPAVGSTWCYQQKLPHIYANLPTNPRSDQAMG